MNVQAWNKKINAPLIPARHWQIGVVKHALYVTIWDAPASFDEDLPPRRNENRVPCIESTSCVVAEARVTVYVVVLKRHCNAKSAPHCALHLRVTKNKSVSRRANCKPYRREATYTRMQAGLAHSSSISGKAETIHHHYLRHWATLASQGVTDSGCLGPWVFRPRGSWAYWFAHTKKRNY